MDRFMHNTDARPAKRRRVGMVVPDGFLESTNAPPKPVHKPSVPQFASAFGDNNTAPQPKPQSKRTASVKPTVKKPLSHQLQDTAHSRDAAKGSSSRRVEIKPPSVLKPPKIFSVQDIHKEFALDAPSKPKPQLRPAPRPPSLASTSTPKTPLRPIAAPAFPIAKAPSKALHPLQPPANPVLASIRNNNHTPGKDLRTLSAAGLGILTDLSSEYGTEDLASILLRDQNKELYAQAGDDATRRGLELSPDKKSKEGATRFVRGGLAAHASTYFDRTHTAFVLWQRQKELERSRANAVPSGADFRASILKVIYRSSVPTQPSRSSTNSWPTTVIALCRIHQPNGDAHPLFMADQLYKVVLSCPGMRTSNTGLEGLTEGQTVRVYKPWHQMCASQAAGGLEGAGVHVPRLPASLPLLSSAPLSTPNPLDAPMSDTTLFCSRYFIR